MGTLYVVGLPIGNLDDITLRALEVLRGAGIIFCEDTRRTGILCARHNISAPRVSCHAHNERGRVPQLLRRLEAGESVCYVSDAGTPAISDPGGRVVGAARAGGHTVVPIPGCSAVTALLSVSGLPVAGFAFIGFLPRSAGKRRRALEGALGISGERSSGATVVLFESPHRIVGLLELLDDLAPGCTVVIGRELTKRFEEIMVGSPGELPARLGEPRGEFTVLVHAGRTVH